MSCARPRLLAALLAVALAAAALDHRQRHDGCPAARCPGQAHNPLEAWAVHNVRLAAVEGVEGGPTIRCNVTTLPGAAAWVELSWSGLGRGKVGAKGGPGRRVLRCARDPRCVATAGG